eukprot:4780964-Amphidinium_carterae.1
MLVYVRNIQDALKQKTISLRRGAVITEILSLLEPLEDSIREDFTSGAYQVFEEWCQIKLDVMTKFLGKAQHQASTQQLCLEGFPEGHKGFEIEL